MKQVAALVLLSGLLVSCGSSGGGGDAAEPSSGAAAPTIVSGSVQVPNGQIAFFQPLEFMDRLASVFGSPAYASLSGASAVPDGTLVELDRYNSDASSFSPLATSRTAGGRYSFNLTSLGLQYSNDLIIRVSNGPSKFVHLS